MEGVLKNQKPMPAIDVVVPQEGPRLWQAILIERLESSGADAAVTRAPGGQAMPSLVGAALAAERRLFRRPSGPASPAPDIAERKPSRAPALRIDLAGVAPPSDVPTLRLTFDGASSDLAVMLALAEGRLPTLKALLDGKVAARAWPMVDRRESVALGADDVLARAVTLVLSVVDAWSGGALSEAGDDVEHPGENIVSGASLVRSYLLSAMPRLAREALRRIRYRHAHWRVGYRFIDGPGVAEIGSLGIGWSVLPDEGDHFYADPFPFMHAGRAYVFVEDYPHATGKAVISLVAFDADGRPQPPRPVLEEPHHLSYPQVFERDGAIWMLPEATSSGRLTLYKAKPFPDRWIAESVLIEDRELSDATLLEHGDRLWLFATERDGYGSTSDTMVVFHAPALAGPWTPHPMNPVMIDRRAARPGGAFVRADGRTLLPVQDGTLGYGGGLGLSELLELTPETVRLSPPQPIPATGDFPYPRIHTLNRAGRLEVIDGIAAVPKRSGGKK